MTQAMLLTWMVPLLLDLSRLRSLIREASIDDNGRNDVTVKDRPLVDI
jgi:hypothetical protein